MKYAWDVAKTTLRSRAHELCIFYDSKFDCDPDHDANTYYEPKLGYDSSHSAVLDLVPAGSKVVDLGCAGGYMCALLQRDRDCVCTGVDMFPLPRHINVARFIQHDLNSGIPELVFAEYDRVLLLDILEHLMSPELFLDRLRESMKYCTRTKVIVTTPNVGFIIIRLMLLLGQFNYGKRGILDLTHKRLFTFASIGHLFEQHGFQVSSCRGIPAPYPVVLGQGLLSRLLLALNNFFIRLLPTVFSYQILVVAEPRPSLEILLQRALDESAIRAQAMSASNS
jgi:2-polyprenyl-3-methyl-5-hydroxy-6-metoxy-1,4-benzoquinol methylase